MKDPDNAPLPMRRDLAQQLELLESWLQTADAFATARSLLARRGLNGSADDLLNEAWLKIRAAVTRRVEPYPDLTEPRHAARFGARVLDNLSRDWLRASARRGEVELLDGLAGTGDDTSVVDTRMLLQQLLTTVAKQAQDLAPCHGCPTDVVAAGALELIHLVLAGQDGGDRGRSWMDQMMYLALERVDGGVERSAAASNQRKARCGKCVNELLQSAASELSGAST